MFAGMEKQSSELARLRLSTRMRTQSVVAALLRQDGRMSPVKRDRWTEGDVDALPAGEHDFFERKSGRLFERMDELKGKLAKTASALANSGGGHIVLGVDDSGNHDGVPSRMGRTPVREWLEQVLPYLVAYPLSDFRVHVVERSVPSRIPDGREVVVIDIGDSALAPHQCVYGGGDASKHVYYYRQAGRSEPAPHFYLELLRQRLVNPALEVKHVALSPIDARRIEGSIFLDTTLDFVVENVGRVVAYKWQVQMMEIDGHPDERLADYRFQKQAYPIGADRDIRMRIDDTILPGGSLKEKQVFGMFLRPAANTPDAIREEINRMVLGVTLGYRLATETSPGELKHIALRDVADCEKLLDIVVPVLASQ